MDDCLFCKIVRGEIAADKIYEDENTLAFLDLHPNTPGHTLVIPKDHFENIYAISDETWVRTMLTAKKIAVAVKNGLEADGMNIIMNNESAGGQLIFHAHIHIIPQYIKNDHVKGQLYKEGEAIEITKKIKESLLI